MKFEKTSLRNQKAARPTIMVFLTGLSLAAALWLAPAGAEASVAITPASTPAPTPTATPTAEERVPAYPEKRGIVSLTLTSIYNRIPLDNEDYKVTKKRTDIYQRKLATAMHEKYVAENTDAPQPIYAAQRVAFEKQLHIDWRNSELEFESYQNDLQNKLDSIKSDLKGQYTGILDIEKSLVTYGDEMTKLLSDIALLEAQISVGVAKTSDMDAYTAQKARLEADIAAKERDLDLAKFNLKADLRIDQSKDISLAPYDAEFVRYNDKNIKKDIAEAVAASFTMTNSEKKLEILREERAIMLEYDREGAMLQNLQNNEISIKETEYAVVNARNTTEAGLWSSYYNLLNQEDQVEIERLNLKLAESDYNVTAAKLEQGLVKKLDVQNANLTLENAKQALQTAINTYMRMSEDFVLELT